MSGLRLFDADTSRGSTGRWQTCLCCMVAAGVLLGGSALRAESQQAAGASGPTVKKPSPRHVRKAAQVEAAPEPEPAPPQPEVPHWPVNDNPGRPSVTWDAHGLKIEAANSSLKQILNDVANATGAKVEGLGQDQRVFGDFGPGQAKDVLSQLLVGSGYNVLMIGDQGEGTPRQIVLSTRRTGKNQAAAENRPQQPEQDMQQDEDAPEQPEVEEPYPQPQPQPQINNRPPILPPPGAPPEGARTPQQVLQELQQRQQQMQDQQQIAPQQDPPGPPPQE